MIENVAEMDACQGPLIWYDAGPGMAILECAACGYIVVAGSLLDPPHVDVPLLREGLAS